jgi:hypothetical protein
MRRLGGLLIGLALFIASVSLGLYGLFAILYRGDGGGTDTYVSFGGHKVDADVVGATALLVAIVLLLFAVPTLFGRKRRLSRPS